MSKQKQRAEYRSIAKSLSFERKAEASRSALSALEKECSDFSLVASYMPLNDELNLEPLNQMLATKGKLALPRVEVDSLSFYTVRDLKELVRSSWNILEPSPSSASLIAPSAINLLLIPGLSFDSSGHRLGRGKGFYDRFLEKNGGLNTLGVIYRELFSKEPLPRATHDQKVNRVYTF